MNALSVNLKMVSAFRKLCRENCIHQLFCLRNKLFAAVHDVYGGRNGYYDVCKSLKKLMTPVDTVEIISCICGKRVSLAHLVILPLISCSISEKF